MSDLSKCLPGRAHGDPLIAAKLRVHPEDFVVHECLDLPADETNSAAHLWLHIEKRERNTQDVASQLAAALECPVRDVGFAGLKDRRAVTRQWFSLPSSCVMALGLTAADADVATQVQSRLSTDCGAQVLAGEWRSRKLRRGAHAGNRFEITLRDVQAIDSGARLVNDLEKRVTLLRDRGFPNAFGPQRFGAGARNLSGARRLFSRAGSLPRPKGQRQRHERGMLLSAARAYLFNRVLADRIADGTWLQALEGEPLMLAGSNSRFLPDALDDTILQRLAEGDLSTSGPLAGRGSDGATAACRLLESSVLDSEPDLIAGLGRAGVEVGRRALRAQARDLECVQVDECSWTVRVSLDAGVYMTSLLAEIGECQDGREAL